MRQDTCQENPGRGDGEEASEMTTDKTNVTAKRFSKSDLERVNFLIFRIHLLQSDARVRAARKRIHANKRWSGLPPKLVYAPILAGPIRHLPG